MTMKKLKRAGWIFGSAIAAEIKRFHDYLDRAEAEWEADPVGVSRRFDEAFNFWAWRVIGIITISVMVDVIIMGLWP